MDTENDGVFRVINDLIATCYDSHEGFGKAAKGCYNEQLRTYFTEISARRAEFAEELQREVSRMGGEPATSGHWGGILHGGWVDLEARIRPRDDLEFVANCEEGEDATRQHYERALAEDLPRESRALIERQYKDTLETLEEIRSLEEHPQER